MNVLPWLDDVARDVRYAARSLCRAPAYTVVAILTLGFGIGANTAIFSVVRAVLLNPLPYADADRLVLVSERWPNFSGPRPVSMRNFLDWEEQQTRFEQLAAVSWGSATVDDMGTPISVSGSLVSTDYFDVFGVRAAIGRTFAPDDSQAGRERVVVLGHRLWMAHFGGDPAVVGTQVRIDRQPYTIIGVMPARTNLDFPTDPQLWRPLMFEGLPPRSSRQLRSVVGKLRQGATIAQARAEMTVIGERLANAYPESNKDYGVLVDPYPSPVGLNVEPSLHLLLAAAAAVLLLGCVNLANLALVRGGARAREVAIRSALGAGRSRLVRQFMTEHMMLAAGGVLCGGLIGTLILGVPIHSGVTASGPGRQTVASADDIAWTIVGIINDEGVSPFDDRMAEPAVYATREQHPRSGLALVVRTAQDPTRMQEAIRRTVAAFDRDQALADVRTLEQLKAEDVAPERLRSLLLILFAAVALALAAIGVYGVIASSVAQRAREMGIRASLGASRANVLALVMRQGMTAVMVGLGAGVGMTLLMARSLDTFLYGVGPWDPRTMASVTIVMATVALIACYVPARRAARVEPIVALRAE